MLVCATFVTGFEGVSLVAYPDKLAHGLPTVCAGETEHVKLGDHYTAEQCKVMLANKLPRYWSEINKCIKVTTSDNEKIAYTSASYNFGTAGFCGSAIVKRLNKGDHTAACNGLMAWDHASGKQIAGLTRRRAAERKICLTPDTEDKTEVTTLASTMAEPLPVPDMDSDSVSPFVAVPARVVHHKQPHILKPHVVVCTGWLWNRECK